MRGDVGVVRGALECEIERDLHAELARPGDEPLEIRDRSELRQNVLVAALRGADRPGAPDIVRRRLERVVRALAVHPSDRLYGRKVHDIEAHLRDVGQARLHVLETPVPRGLG